MNLHPDKIHIKFGTSYLWLCRCDCDNETNVGPNELQNGDTVRCGCYQIERMLKSLRLIDNTSVTLLEHCKKPGTANKSGYPGFCMKKWKMDRIFQF